MKWDNLLRYKLKNGGKEYEKEITEMSSILKSSLVNGDPVTCVLYFDELVNVIMIYWSQKIIAHLENIKLSIFSKK